MALLSVQKLEVGYGEIQVLWGVDLVVGRGEIVALVGSNGAGKTTLLRCLSGLLSPRAGAVHFDGEPVSGLNSSALVERGLLHVPEGRRLFAGMTVRDNLLMGAYLQRDRAEIRQDLERAYGLFPVRGLMARPRLMLIDELSLGLAPVAVERLMPVLREIHQQGVSILLVEQDAQTALEMAERAYVLERGTIALQGTGREVLANEHVRRAYLGL